MWLHVKPGTRTRCAQCTRSVTFGLTELFINLDYLDVNYVEYTCDCGAVFQLQDFLRSGAELVDAV